MLPGLRNQDREGLPQLSSKAPFSRRFEDAIGEVCENAAARQVARRFERSNGFASSQ
jgi:hypothetical protein